MNLTPDHRRRAEEADQNAPWHDWELVVTDPKSERVICIARTRVELLERTPTPQHGTTWNLTWRRRL